MSGTEDSSTCTEHTGMQDYVQGCDACAKEREARTGRLGGQVDQANHIMKRLAEAGIQPPATVFLASRLEALIELSLDGNERLSHHFEEVAGDKVLDQLREGQRQVYEASKAQARSLVVPTGKNPSGLHVAK